MASDTGQATPVPSPTSGFTFGGPKTNPAGSPPVILAFFAIGVFVFSVVVVFGWKRVHEARVQRSGFEVQGRGQNVTEVPKLWDLWRDQLLQKEQDVRWDNIKPVAATIVCEDEKSPLASKSVDIRWWQAYRPPRPVGVDIKADPTSPPLASLQVAIAIMMPFQQSGNRQIPKPDDPQTGSGGRLDYTIGLYSCVWSKEGR